jgi:hypothetical protein
VSQLYPEIIDRSTIQGVFALDQFLVIGVEGQADSGGTAAVATPYKVFTPEEANTLFGAASSLAQLVKFVLAKGINYVIAVASAKGAAPTLVQRQAAWTVLEEDQVLRVRLTDSITQADLVALADSCEWAEGIQNKQFCVIGLTTPTTEAALLAAATAISSKRAVLVGPGVYNENGTLLNGAYAAAWTACEIAKNPDIADDLDTAPLNASNGIEKDANGMPLFRIKAGAGTPVNQFTTLLNGGVSPLRQGKNGQAEITHLRTTYTIDSTFDALLTLLVKDQLFIDIRAQLEEQKFLRKGNTPENRSLAAQVVDSYLRNRAEWVRPKTLPDGSIGYGVTVTASPDNKKMIVNYMGEVVRNTQVIEIVGVLTIPA